MYRFMSNIVQITISFLSHALPLVVNHCSKHSKPLGTPPKLGDGNCLFRAVSFAVTGRHEIYYTRGRAQIINHMNSSLDSYLTSGQMARNKVRVKGIERLSTASLLSTEIFVCTQFGESHFR